MRLNRIRDKTGDIEELVAHLNLRDIIWVLDLRRDMRPLMPRLVIPACFLICTELTILVECLTRR